MGWKGQLVLLAAEVYIYPTVALRAGRAAGAPIVVVIGKMPLADLHAGSAIAIPHRIRGEPAVVMTCKDRDGICSHEEGDDQKSQRETHPAPCGRG